MVLSGRDINANFSFSMTKHNAIQLIHKVVDIHILEVFLADRYTAKNEIPMNKKSIEVHHAGAVSQHIAEHV